MAETLWNVDWLNQNSQRKYPLTDAASGADTTGSIVLPDDFLVDMVLALPLLSGLTPAGFHLMTLTVLPQGVLLVFGHQGVAVGLTSINKATHTRYAPYRVVGQGDFFDAYGTVTIGSFENMDLLPAGMYTFTEDAGRLIPTVVHPDIRGVSSLRILQGRDLSEPLTGDIYLIAGRNTRFQVAGNQVTIDALPLSQDLAEECGCASQTEAAPCIKTINGVQPTAEGNITLEGDQCLQTREGVNLISLIDQCSKPCCGCDELKVVLDQSAGLINDAATLRSKIYQLEGIVAQLGIVLAASQVSPLARVCPGGTPYRIA